MQKFYSLLFRLFLRNILSTAVFSAAISPLVATSIEWLLTGAVSWVMIITSSLVGFIVSLIIGRIIANFQQTIRQQNKELKQLAQELQDANQQLQNNNHELDAFAHTVAHDLKNPIAAIVGYSEMLLEYRQKLSEEQIEHHLQAVARSGGRMKNIINALLLLANVRQENEVNLAPLNMAEIVQEVEDRLQYLIEEQNGQIEKAENWPPAVGYAPWIEEVWVNYLSNGLKYGGRPPHLTIGATLNGSFVHFWVKDNGPGLTAEQQTQLFAEFTRLNQAQVEGHGLGLSIVKRIVEKCGGKVWVESEGVPGRGSTFYFALPIPPTS
jgi:signal transduction histidine kinase